MVIASSCPQLSKRKLRENNKFLIKCSARVFIAMSSEFTLVTILTSSVLSDYFMNLVDRDLTEHQITQTLTLS